MGIKRDVHFVDILPFQDLVNKLFYDTYAKSMVSGRHDVSWTPAVDIYETEKNIVLKAEVPGIDEKEINVSIEENTLILKGERKLKRDIEEENFHRVERRYGTFERRFPLPGTIDKNSVTADCRDGVLEITIPKREEKNRKIIKVQSE